MTVLAAAASGDSDRRRGSTKISALLSGLALGIGMPAIEALGVALGLSQGSQNLAFLFGLVFLFFGPVLAFVVGEAHLGIKSRAMLKGVYWASPGQFGLHSILWIVGCGLGFAWLAAVRGLSP